MYYTTAHVVVAAQDVARTPDVAVQGFVSLTFVDDHMTLVSLDEPVRARFRRADELDEATRLEVNVVQ